MEDKDKEVGVSYAIINNIPVEYHSADLRNYFSQFIEEKGFECFHFRHRPEQVQAENEQNVVANQSSETNNKRTTCCVIKLKTKQLQKFLKMYQRKHWVDKKGEIMRQMCYISRIRQPNASGISNVFGLGYAVFAVASRSELSSRNNLSRDNVSILRGSWSLS